MKTLNLTTRLLCVITLWAGALTCAFASSQILTQPKEEGPKESYNLKVSSPIFRSSARNIDLDVTVPQGYRPLQTAKQAAKLKLLQFIPIKETPRTWTNMIVLQIIGNQSITASQFVEMIAKKVKEKAPDATILLNDTLPQEDYVKSTLGITYHTGKRREISYMEYFSSEKHLSGIQYVRVISDDDNPEAVLKEIISEVDKIAKVSRKVPKGKQGLQVYWDNMIQMDYPFSDNPLLVDSSAAPIHWAGVLGSTPNT